MINRLKQLFDQHVGAFADEPTNPHELELSAAALLMEIGRADHDISDEERREMAAAMQASFTLDELEIEDLLASAEEAVDESVSLYDFTSIINERFDRGQKIQLLEMLWRVAFADDDLDRYEEYYIRKISDLLHVSHKDFIATKERARTR